MPDAKVAERPEDRMLPQALAAEFIGTAMLLIVIVGSGIVPDSSLPVTLAGLALFVHAVTIGLMLIVLIMIFAPVSGGHFNPAVTLVFLVMGEVRPRTALLYVIVQVVGALIGVMIAHLSFEMSVLTVGTKVRTGYGQFIGEMIATFMLLLTILAVRETDARRVPIAVGFVILGAIIYTSSACFANPAVSVARAFTDTFTSIRPVDVPAFVVAQLVSALLALFVFRWLYPEADQQG